jgi:hypothetical protein
MNTQTKIYMAKESTIKGSSFFLTDYGILHDKLFASVLYFFIMFPIDWGKVKA